MADFDWAWPTKIERDVIERALTLDFLHEGRNLVMVGRNGLGGKTMMAKNICQESETLLDGAFAQGESATSQTAQLVKLLDLHGATALRRAIPDCHRDPDARRDRTPRAAGFGDRRR